MKKKFGLILEDSVKFMGIKTRFLGFKVTGNRIIFMRGLIWGLLIYGNLMQINGFLKEFLEDIANLLPILDGLITIVF